MTHPYKDAAPHRLWRRAIGEAGEHADPAIGMPFRIAHDDRVVTAGSCFAQHISRHLKEGGFRFMVTEPAHPVLDPAIAERHNYGRFTARYGNIYTARQLLQLLRRAFGRFTPQEDIWAEQDGSFVDPFRPQIQPGGFLSREEYAGDRGQHLAAVRMAFEQADIFIFTLGLTEAWESAEDGAVFPVCPGTASGTFDAARHHFRNHDVDDVVGDLSAFIAELRAINPAVCLIFTVSPVPLVATATDGHVLNATTYSKSVLRVAAEMVARRCEGVAYFPSYEIITGPQARGQYFAEDLRSVTEAGVDRVMQLFFLHATEGGATTPQVEDGARQAETFRTESRQLVDILCDEEALDPLARGQQA